MWKTLFRIKGAWNCAGSVAFLLLDDELRRWQGVGPADPAYRALFHCLAFVFGIGYWWVGRDLDRNHDIVRMGILGQLSVFAVLTWEVLVAGRLTWFFLVPGLIDLAFALGFVWFLWTYPRSVWKPVERPAVQGDGK